MVERDIKKLMGLIEVDGTRLGGKKAMVNMTMVLKTNIPSW